MKSGLVSVGLGAIALALLADDWRGALALLAAGAFIAAAFVGVPARLVAYVQARRGAEYEGFFSIALPIGLALLSAFMAWQEIDVAIVIGDWPWTDVAVPICYAFAAILNLAVFVRNVLSLRRGTR
jgi:hypothetical protein